MLNVVSKQIKTAVLAGCTLFGGFLGAPAQADEEATGGFVRPVDPDIAHPESHTGLYLGGRMGFGQARSTDGGSPGLSFRLGVEPGYQVQTGSWTRLEAGAEIFFGRLSFRSGSGDNGYKAGIPIGLGVMPKLGYGYSLGGGLYGSWKLGVGPVLGRFAADRNDGATLEAKDTLWGVAGQLGASLQMPASEHFLFVAGVDWTHYQFDLGDLKVKSSAGTVTETAGRSININAIEATLGARLVF